MKISLYLCASGIETSLSLKNIKPVINFTLPLRKRNWDLIDRNGNALSLWFHFTSAQAELRQSYKNFITVFVNFTLPLRKRNWDGRLVTISHFSKVISLYLCASGIETHRLDIQHTTKLFHFTSAQAELRPKTSKVWRLMSNVKKWCNYNYFNESL